MCSWPGFRDIYRKWVAASFNSLNTFLSLSAFLRERSCWPPNLFLLSILWRLTKSGRIGSQPFFFLSPSYIYILYATLWGYGIRKDPNSMGFWTLEIVWATRASKCISEGKEKECHSAIVPSYLALDITYRSMNTGGAALVGHQTSKVGRGEGHHHSWSKKTLNR